MVIPRSDIAKGLVLILLFQLVLIGITAPAPAGASETTVFHQTDFVPGKSTYEIKFSGYKEDKSTDLEIQYGLDVSDAYLMVSGSENGGSYPENITVDLWDDGNMNWKWSEVGYGPLGMQDRFMNDNTTQNITFKYPSSNDDYTIMLPKGATVQTASMKFKNPSMGTGKVLVLGSEYSSTGFTHIANALNGKDGINDVDTWNMYNKNAPSLEEMMGYDKILIWTSYSYSSNFDKLGNNLADYVDNGGGVVVGYWAFYDYSYYIIGGRWKNEQYSPIKPGGYFYDYYNYPNVNIGTKDDPSHPILEGITSSNVHPSRYMTSQTTCGYSASERIFMWNNNYVGACTKEKDGNEVVALNTWFVPSTADSYSGWTGSQMYDLFYNSLMYAGFQEYDVQVDIGSDGNSEWTKTAFGSDAVGNEDTLVGSSYVDALNNYLSTHPATVTDDYGNQLVEVPFKVTLGSPGKLTMTDMRITYDYAATIKKDHEFPPLDEIGSFKEEINERLPDVISTNKMKRNIEVKSDTAGKIKLFGLNITYTPYPHEPEILSMLPEDNKVNMNEDTSVHFEVSAKDNYNNPLVYMWTVNNKVVAGENTNSLDYYADFNSVRSATITCEVNNTQMSTFATWGVTINNVNRLPSFVVEDEAFNPVDYSVSTEEGGELVFTVVGFDLDFGPPPLTKWLVDDVEMGGLIGSTDTPNSPHGWYPLGSTPTDGNATYSYTWTYRPDYYAADFSPYHIVEVVLFDINDGEKRHTWEVYVENMNTAPVIDSFKPSNDGFIIEENTSRKFSVISNSIDGDLVMHQWWVDEGDGRVDIDGAIESEYTYNPTYTTVEDGDTKDVSICVDAYDAEQLTVNHCWEITVKDVNRAPIIVITSPISIEEDPNVKYNDLSPVTFDASPSFDLDAEDVEDLEFEWFEGDDMISDEAEFEHVVRSGTHSYVVKVTDSRNVFSEQKVTFSVEPANINIAVSRPDFVEAGDKVPLKLIVENNGDIDLKELDLTIYVDDDMLFRESIDVVKAKKTFEMKNSWKAVQGNHEVIVVYNKGKEGEKSERIDTINVQEKQIISLGAASQEMGFGITLIVAMALIGAVFFITRKKPRKPVQEAPTEAVPVDDTAVQPDPYATDQAYYDQQAGYEGGYDQQYYGQEGYYDDGTASGASTVVAKGSAAEAEQAMMEVQEMIDQAQEAGLDASKAETKLKVAEKYYEKQNYTKAAEYAREAMDKLNAE